MFWFKSPHLNEKLPVTIRIVCLMPQVYSIRSEDNDRVDKDVASRALETEVFLRRTVERRPVCANRCFRTNLDRIDEVSVPRCISDNEILCELHGFCDASEKVYGAVMYPRSVT